MLQTYRRYHGYFTGASTREPLVTSNVLSGFHNSWMPPVGKGSGQYRHVFDGDVPPFPCGSPPTCTSLSPSRITTAAPLASLASVRSGRCDSFSRSRSSFQLLSRHPLMIPHPTTLIANSPAPPIFFTFTLSIHFPIIPPRSIFIPQYSLFLPDSKSSTRIPFRPLVILPPYSCLFSLLL